MNDKPKPGYRAYTEKGLRYILATLPPDNPDYQIAKAELRRRGINPDKKVSLSRRERDGYEKD